MTLTFLKYWHNILFLCFSAASILKHSALIRTEKLAEIEPSLFSKLANNWLLGERLKTERELCSTNNTLLITRCFVFCCFLFSLDLMVSVLYAKFVEEQKEEIREIQRDQDLMLPQDLDYAKFVILFFVNSSIFRALYFKRNWH